MAKKRLKRSLFIGLGGTGAKAIIHTKKRFIDTYGKVPPMVAFLAIDTDDDVINFKLDNHLGTEKIKLDTSEFLYSKVRDPQMVLKRNPELFNFVPEKNRDILQDLTKGAGQIRSNGRFAIHFNYSGIEYAVNNKLTSILNAATIDDPEFETNGDDVEINMMFSLAGGTGSGTFIDMAYIIKEASKSIDSTVGVSIIGFAVLPDVFSTMMTGPAMKNALPNGFGAMYDLDYLMHHNYKKRPLEIKYSNKTITIERPPFDLVFTINNKDKRGNTYTNIGDISELIGLAMFTGASELSGNMKSSYDNVKPVLADKSLDVEDKKAWACGMGLSELFYDGNKLGNIYARKVEVAIINNLLTPESESFDMADLFIDKVKIRENNGDEHNELIDSLLSEAPKIPFSFIQNIDGVDSEVFTYIQNVKESAKLEIEENYKEKKEFVFSGLYDFIVENINKQSGVGNTKEFLESLERQVKLFTQEMQNEKAELLDNEKLYDAQLKQIINELNGLGFVDKKLGNKLKDTKDDVIQSTNLVAANIHERLRREFAISFLNELLEEISSYKTLLKDVIHKLNKVKEKATNKYLGLQNQIDEEPKKFVKELHRDFVNNITVDDNDYNVTDFIKYVYNKSEKGIFDFSEISENMIDNTFWKYTKELDKALEYRNKRIDDILSEYSEDKLKTLFKALIQKSNPLWSYDYKGYVVNPVLHEAFVIGVPNEKDSVIVKEKILDDILETNQKISFNSTSMDDRIVVYRMEAAVPSFAVSNMALYEEKNNMSRISHQIDANWLLRMEREGFSIHPTRKEDNSLEYWVLGFIYGFIKFDDEQYQVQSENQGKGKYNYWLSLGKYRDEAFDEYKRLKLQEELKTKIDKKISKIGDSENEKLILNVAEGSNYIDEYSQKNFEISDLEDSKMAKVDELFDKEIDFVKKVLAN